MQSMLFVQKRDYLHDGEASPRIKLVFGESAIPCGEGISPSNIVQGHGIDDGAVAIEKISAEFSIRELQGQFTSRSLAIVRDGCEAGASCGSRMRLERNRLVR